MTDNIKNKSKELLFNRNFKKFGFDLNLVVSLGAGLIVLGFSLFACIDVEYANQVFSKINSIVVNNFDWVFILSSNLFIIVSLILAFSKFGNVVIGGINAKPEYSNFSWYAMLFSAGMGIGLMFWSVGEPLTHQMQLPPIFKSTSPETQALATTFFHWGIHPWGIYTLISLALAFFAYNKHLPLSFRSIFYPILKDKIFGIWGDIIDIFAVVCCLFGLATSLGLGAKQINSGLSYLFGVPNNSFVQVLIIIFITAIATLSVVSGIKKGVKLLSQGNIILAGVILLIIAILGPTGKINRTLFSSIGLYFNNFVKESFFIDQSGSSWQGNWTIFYLAWWVSCSPFVGIFIAKISKGRTIREFVLAIMFIPAALSFVWLSVFGVTALDINSSLNGGLFQTVNENISIALFEMYKYLDIPFMENAVRAILSFASTILIVIFFVTSSDSGSLVVDQLTSGGKNDSPTRQKVFWAGLEGLTAIVLIMVGGEQALKTLQTAVIASGLPFSILLIVAAFVLIKGVKISHKKQINKKEFKKFKSLIEVYTEDNTDTNFTSTSMNA